MPTPDDEVRLAWFATDLDVDGHVPAAMVPYDNATSSLVADNVQAAIDEIVAAAGVAGTGWFNVRDYGAAGNGTADDTAAVNSAIAALNTATSGVLYFPAGTYKCTAALTTITAQALILGDGHGYADTHGGGGSEVRQTSATAVLFTVTGVGTRFLNIGLRCTAATPSAGSGIHASADFVRYDNVAVSNFYDCIDHNDGGAFKIDGCWIVGPVRYGVRVRDVSSPDGGDQAFSNSWFYADQRNSTSAIRLESGGGTKITNCKINKFVSGHQFTHGIDVTVASGITTTILNVTNCSIENYTGDGIHVDGSVGSWDILTFSGIQIGQYGNGSGKAFNIDNADNVIITDCNLKADTGTPTAVSLANGTRALVGPFVNQGFSTLLATSSYTSVDDRTTVSTGAPTTADYLTGTAQGGLSAEIVVGTTPNGELGGTWGAITVDATHSGSTHAATQAAAEATAAAALAVHVAAGSMTDHDHIIDVFSGDAATTAFEISEEPLDPEAVFAFVGGLWTAVTVSGVMNTTVTFGSAPGSGTNNVVIQYPAVAA
jgi:hypothetical protein